MSGKDAVADRNRQLEILINSVVDYAIYMIDADGHVQTWNAGAERLKGYLAHEIIGRSFSNFYTEKDRQAGTPKRALETARTEGRFAAEGWRVRKDGTRFWASVVIDAIYDEQKNVIGFAKVTRDITERHEAQEMLRKTQEQLAAAQKLEAVGQLSGGVAHDFNNLLMIIMGNLETLQRDGPGQGLSDRLQRNTDNAMRAAQRAAALTSRLLAFSRRQPLDPRPISVNKFLTGAVDFLQRSLGERVSVEAVGSAGVWTIEADVNQLESALVNLGINARDAMPEGGKLTIEAENVFADEAYARANPEISAGQYVVISVTDTGHGMDAETLARAFEPFYTTKQAGQGTGLGLSQVYGFVKQSGGNVKIYSEVGQGTSVKMYFPRFLGAGEEQYDGRPEVPVPGEARETILLVEDDLGVQEYLVETLHMLGYSVLQSSNAQAALEILRQGDLRIDLMLTDVVMPGMNGRELGQQAAALRSKLPVLYMTGYSRNAIVHQGRLKPGVDFLQKPVSQAQLSTRIRDMLDRSRSEP